MIARPRSIPTSLGRPVEPCGAPARRVRTTPATSSGGRIFTDMVERHPVAGLGVAPAPSLLTRRVLPQRAGDVRATMSELAAQPRSGLAARACSREVPREPWRRSPSYEIRRPRPSAHRRSPRTGVAQERCPRAPPTLSSQLASLSQALKRRGPRGELPHHTGDRPGHAPRATTSLQPATVFQPTSRSLSPMTTRRRLIG